MIAPGIDQIERGAAKLDRTFAVHNFVGNDDIRDL